MKKILREIFSGANGKLSAKRVIGGLAMLVALICTTVLVFRDGSNTVVENLLMTIFITSVSLLGLPAVTGIWGNTKVNVGNSKSEENEEAPVQEPEAPKQEIPDCENCEYKNRHHRR
jgi:hypothetical protein